jgi:hypothetical protein
MYEIALMFVFKNKYLHVKSSKLTVVYFSIPLLKRNLYLFFLGEKLIMKLILVMLLLFNCSDCFVSM